GCSNVLLKMAEGQATPYFGNIRIGQFGRGVPLPCPMCAMTAFVGTLLSRRCVSEVAQAIVVRIAVTMCDLQHFRARPYELLRNKLVQVTRFFYAGHSDQKRFAMSVLVACRSNRPPAIETFLTVESDNMPVKNAQVAER